ncbi:MAG: CBS domain-containing protein [Myxococcota bacterium]
MTGTLFTVREDMRVLAAVRSLLKHRLSGAPVVDDQGLLIGMLSERDCIHALVRAVVERLPSSYVRDVMTTDVLTISESADLLSIAHIFVTRPMRRIPVVDEERHLVGQISRHDLLATAVAVWDEAPSRQAAVLYLSATGRVTPFHHHGRRV